MSHKKFGPDRFSRFDVYWIQTNKQTDKQTDRQAKFIYRRSAKNPFNLKVECTNGRMYQRYKRWNVQKINCTKDKMYKR